MNGMRGSGTPIWVGVMRIESLSAKFAEIKTGYKGSAIDGEFNLVVI